VPVTLPALTRHRAAFGLADRQHVGNGNKRQTGEYRPFLHSLRPRRSGAGAHTGQPDRLAVASAFRTRRLRPATMFLHATQDPSPSGDGPHGQLPIYASGRQPPRGLSNGRRNCLRVAPRCRSSPMFEKTSRDLRAAAGDHHARPGLALRHHAQMIDKPLTTLTVTADHQYFTQLNPIGPPLRSHPNCRTSRFRSTRIYVTSH